MSDDLKYVETTQVKEGVVCEVWIYEGDETKDLGIVTVEKGHKTPLQRVLKGDKTLEIYKKGVGSLTVTRTNGDTDIYEYPGAEVEVEIKVGDIVQWKAEETLVFHEICYPPYADGRFENIG